MSLPLVNIEIGHVQWETPVGVTSAVESSLIAMEWLAGQGISRDDAVIGTLVDDKKFPVVDREAYVSHVAQIAASLATHLDYVCFESDLASIADAFVSLLMRDNRQRRAREFARYRNKHGSVACSHDIAIWHSFRLGQLRPASVDLYRLDTSKVPADVAPFFSGQVVSVLEDSNRGEELRAKEILLELQKKISESVHILYYSI